MAGRSADKGHKRKGADDKRGHRHGGASSGPHPTWSGTISFGLVSVPVDVYSAQRSGRIALRMLDHDGTPLQRKYYCPEHGTEVHPEHIVRGYDLGDETYVLVREDELEALSPRKSRDIDLTRFVRREQISPRYFQRSYLLTPAGESTKAYRLLAQVMERTGRAGIATFVMRGKEYLVVILAEGGILRAQTLRFADELRSPQDAGLPEPLEVEEREVARLEKAIRSQTLEELPEELLRDLATEKLQALIEDKQRRGEDVVKAPEADEDDEDDPPLEVAEDDDEQHAGGGLDLLAKIRQSLRSGSGHAPIAQRTRRSASPDETTEPSGRTTGGRKSDRQSSGRRGSDLKRMSKEELYRRAQERNISGRSKMSKQQLIRSLRETA